MNTNASLLVNSGSGASQVVAIDSGKPIKIKIQPGSKYLLKNNDNNFAPENITLLRNGDDLCIILEGDSTPAVVIEDYYVSGNSEPLLGMAEDGQLYAYIVTDGSSFGEGYLFDNGVLAPAALGGMPLGDGAYLFEETNHDMGLLALWPWFLGAAAVAGIVGNAIYEHNKDNGHHSDPAPAPAPVPVPAEASVPTLEGAIDTTGSITGPIAYGSYTDEQYPIIYGTGSAGNTITIYDNGQKIGTTTVDADGTWSFQPETALNDGSHSITITQTNSDGSTSKPSDDLSFIIDTVAPLKPLIGDVIDNVGAITGPIANGATTDDPRPEITGVGEPGDTITVFINGLEVGKMVVDNNGHWSFTPETDLAEGHQRVFVIETDKAGNVSPLSPTFDFNVDTIPPVKPAVPEAIDNTGDKTGPIKPGDVTDETKPEFNGGGEPGDTIIIKDGDDIIGSTVVDDDGKWEWTPETPLDEGDHSITIIEVDPAGNESEPSDPIEFEIDTTPPVKPAVPEAIDNTGDKTGPIKPGDVTDETKPEFNGGGEPGDTIIIKDGDDIIGSTVVDDDGKWEWTPETPLDEGDHSITIIEVDPAGNESEPSDPIEFEIDTTPPVKPAVPEVIDNTGDKTGPINSGDVTDETKPEFSGEGTPGDTIIIKDGDDIIGSVTIPEDGKWDWTPETPLDEGDHSITIIEKDPAGNESEPSDPIEFEIDTTPPVKPAVPEVTDNTGDKTGPIHSGDVTDETKPEFSGEGTPGDTIIIKDGDDIIGSVTIPEDGKWDWTPETDLAEGEHSITITETDPAGNESEPSAPIEFVVDTTPPAKPAIDSVIDDAGTITGPINNGGATDDTTPTFSGEGDAGDVITFTDNGKVIGSVTIDENGSWKFTPETPLAEGDHEITITETDPAGNKSEPSDPFTFTVDTTAPDLTKLAITGVEDNVGEVTGNITNGGSTDDASPVISGTGTKGDTIVVYAKDGAGNHEIGRATVGEDGKWSMEPTTPLLPGSNVLTAVEIDPVGNTTEPSASYTITLDISKPTEPVIVNVLDDVGPITGALQKGDVTDDNKPTITGTAEAGYTVRIYDGVTLLGSVAADSKGIWTFTPTTALADGQHNITATATSTIGQTSKPTGIFNFEVDTKAPLAADSLKITDDVGAYQGPLKDGDTTDDSTPTFSGKAEANSTVTIYNGDSVIGSTKADASGNWSFTPSNALDDGDYAFSTIVTDKAGNSSPATPDVHITIDTSDVVVSITHLIDDVGPITGDITPNGVTDDTKPEIIGTGKAGSTIKVYDGVVKLGETTVKADGSWSFTPTTALNEGKHSITATATDKAGNTSPATSAFVFTVDTTAPSVPTIDSAKDDVGTIQGSMSSGSVTDDSTPTLIGKAEKGSTVIVYDGTAVLGSTIADSNGDWNFTPATPILEGEHKFHVTATDEAGNVSKPSNDFILTTDYTAPDPSKLAITGVDDQVGELTGNVKSGDSTDDSRPTISGTGTKGDLVTVYSKDSTGNHIIGSATVGADGKWSMQPTTPLLNGENKLTAVESDPVGNTTSPSAAYTIIVSTTGPAAPVIVTVVDDVGSITGTLQKGDVTDDNKPTLNGTADKGCTVKVYDGATLLGSTKADSDGKWTFTPTTALADGTHNLTATATDSIGQVSAPTGIFNIIVDTTAPGKITNLVVTDDVGAYQGPLKSGDVTDDDTPTFSGKAEANGKIIIYDGSNPISSTIANASGDWSYTPTTALPDGSHEFTITVTDKAGNEGEGVTFNLNVDTTGVTVSITALIDDVGAITGPIAQNGVTDDTRPEVTGKGKEGSIIKVYDGENLLGSTTVKADGTWSFTPTSDMGQGEHSITATATDKAGNTSDKTSAFVFSIDTVAPSIPTIEKAIDDVGAIQGDLASGAMTDDSTPTLVGKVEANSLVMVYDGSTLLGSVTAAADGKWSYTPTSAISEGEHKFHVTATDAAGNVSKPSNDFVLTTDYTAPDPSKLAITGVDDQVGTVTGNVKSGDATDDNRPTISGTGTKGDIVTVSTEDSAGKHVIGSATVGADGKWSLQPTTPLLDGENKLTAVESDPVGNTTSPSAAYTIIVSTTGPAAPVIVTVVDDVGSITGTLQKGDVTDDNKPTLNGTADKGCTVKVYDGATLLGSTAADSDGKWTFTPTTALADGTHNLTATATDSIGQVSAPTGIFNIIVDTTAPGKITNLVVTDDVGAYQGPLKSGDVTDDATPTFSGKAEANSKVTIYDGSTIVGTATTNASGDWSFTPSKALDDGAHAFTITATDKAGNEGEAVAFNLNVDTTGVTVSITALIDDVGAITGNIAQNGVTDDTKPEVTGKGKEGSTIKVYDGATLLGSTTVDSDGKWTFTPATALAEGEHSITATATDKAGNTSDKTSAFVFTVDTTAPSVPTIEKAIDDVGSIQGDLASGAMTDDSTPTLVGKAEANSLVMVYDGSTLLGSVTAAADGKWSYTPTSAISEGEHKFHVTATDKAGNVSQPSADFLLTTDYTAPDPSKLAITGVDDKVGLVTGNVVSGGSTDDSRPTISGTGTKGDLITVYSKDSTGNHVIGSATVDANGKWTMQPAKALAEGLNDLTAVEMDAAGNSTDPSAKYSITLDTAVPTTKAKITDITEDTGISDHDFITKDKTLLIGGNLSGEKLPANEKVQISLDNGSTWHFATVSEDRIRWSYDNTAASLADGSYTFQVRVMSESGATGPMSSQVVVIDTTGPTNTTTVDLDPASDWGDFNDDNITGLATPTINGKVTIGSDPFTKLTVTLFDDKNNDGKLDAGDTVFQTGIKVNADGTWTTDLPSLQDGTYKLKGIVVDEAGNLQTPTAGKLIGANGGTDDLVIKSNMRSMLIGEKPGDNAGWIITNVGDFNGDGIDDFFVTAPNADTTVRDLGKSYLLYGTGAGLPNVPHLGAITASQGLIITNTDRNYTQEGMVAVNIGDWNGDGYDDIAVGSHVQDTMFIIYGGPQGTYASGTLDMKDIMAGDNTHGFSISNRNPVTGNGRDAWMFYGITAADVDGDGHKDLIFNNNSGGTYSNGWHTGSVQIIYGGDKLMDGSNWSNIYMKYLGTGGLAYGSYYVPTTDLTKETLTNNVRNTTVAFASTDDNDMGSYMGSVGDVNGDGIEDFFMLGTDGKTHYLVYGKEGGYDQILDLGKFRDGVDGVRFVTNDTVTLVDRWYGYHMVTRLGDINGDGVDDFAFGLPNSGIDRTVVVYGKQGGLGSQSIGIPSAANNTVPTGTKAFTAADGMIILNAGSSLTNWSKSGALFGAALAGGGDLNGDGIADFVIGAPQVTANGKSQCGAIYVIYGQADNYLTGSPVVSINTLINDPSKGYVIYGEKAGEHLGQSITLGDWNGDGLLDIASSAPESSVYARNADGTEDKTHGGSGSGAAYIYYSKVDFTKVYTTGDDILIADGKGIDGKPVDHDLILGGAGNDIILGISTGDFANGGAGNDTIHVATLDFLSVNGGTGIDTLVLDGNDLVLNLGALQAKVQNFEKFDLGSGHNSLTVKLDDVLRMGSNELAIKSGDKAIVVEGETGSTLKLEGAGQWTMAQSNYQHDGHTYNVWTISASGVEVLVENTMTPIIM